MEGGTKLSLKVMLPLVFAIGAGFIYISLTVGKYYDQISISTLMPIVSYAIQHPFPIEVTAGTRKLLLGFMMVWLVLFMKVIADAGNYMPGREYGTSKWESPKKLTKRMADPENPRNDKILSENVRLSLNTRHTGLNNNVLIIGGSGSGKTFYEVKPNGYNCESSYIFCDPKGELLRDIGAYLKTEGYNVLVLNLVDLEQSNTYNPFAYLRNDSDVVKLINNLIANTTPKESKSGDPFWEKAESMYLQALMYYVWMEYPKQGKNANFSGLLELLNKAKVDDDGDLSELDKLMYQLPEDHPALVAYKKVASGAADTIRSIFITANARLAPLQNPQILRILESDEMDIPALGQGVYENPKRKTALFAVIPDNDKSYNFIVGMLYTQIFQELYFIADHKTKDGRLPVHVALWMDEFANVALPDGFCEILSTCRSREISCNIIIQNMAQLKTLFKDSWETIPGNCDVMVYLGGNEQSTHKYISEMLGKFTLDKRSYSQSEGKGGSGSKSMDVIARDLLSPDEVRKLDNKKCIVMLRGCDPVLDYKYKTYEKPEFKRANELGPYIPEASWEALQAQGDLEYFLDPNPGAEDIYPKKLDEKIRSYLYQTETYGGIFEESRCYSLLEVSPDGKGLVPPESFLGYRKSSSPGAVYYPVYSIRMNESVQSGTLTLTKHKIIGVRNKDGFIPLSSPDCPHFTKENRAQNGAGSSKRDRGYRG